MATLYYRPQALETIARHILTRYDEMYLNGKPRAVPIETIIEKTFGLRIEYQYLTNDGRELGRMIYDNGITTYYDRETMDYALMRVEGGTMLIEASLLEDEKYYGRLRFTLAHELAHYILHKRIEFSGPDQFHRVFPSVLTGGYIRVRQSAARGALPERNDKLHPCSLPRSISIAFAR